MGKRGYKPRADRSTIRSKRIFILLTPPEREKLQKDAVTAGVTLAALVRQRLGLTGG